MLGTWRQWSTVSAHGTIRRCGIRPGSCSTGLSRTPPRCAPGPTRCVESPDCEAVIDGSFVDPRHVYRKWQGAHWSLVQLAERGHPGGDPTLNQIQELVFDWILSPAFLKPNWTRYIEGQANRVRRCASMEGNVLWASLQLGLNDERLEALADRLRALQWPDGGWNCDVRPRAIQSSFVETSPGSAGPGGVGGRRQATRPPQTHLNAGSSFSWNTTCSSTAVAP